MNGSMRPTYQIPVLSTLVTYYNVGLTDPAILEGVDYVVNLERNKKNGPPSAIIKLKNDGTVQIIRD